MSGKEAKDVLEAVGGLLMLVNLSSDGSIDDQLKGLISKYYEAAEIAKEAIDLMDNKIDIQSKEE